LIVLNFQQTAKPQIAIKLVFQSVIDALPVSIQTTKIRTTETIFTASKKADIILELRSFRIIGLSKATNKNEDRNIPIVAAIAPGIPASCHPINVADEKTGPGVN